MPLNLQLAWQLDTPIEHCEDMQAIFLDLETTGLDVCKHSAIDIALAVIDLRRKEVLATYQSVIKIDAQAWQKRDLTSMQINGYTWEQLEEGRPVSQVSSEIIALFAQLGIGRGKAVFICQNPAFDRSFFGHIVDVCLQEKLGWPYHWLDLASMAWALMSQQLAQRSEPWPEIVNLSKNALANQYHLPPEPTPHRALQGVQHLITCYRAVIGDAALPAIY